MSTTRTHQPNPNQAPPPPTRTEENYITVKGEERGDNRIPYTENRTPHGEESSTTGKRVAPYTVYPEREPSPGATPALSKLIAHTQHQEPCPQTELTNGNRFPLATVIQVLPYTENTNPSPGGGTTPAPSKLITHTQHQEQCPKTQYALTNQANHVRRHNTPQAAPSHTSMSSRGEQYTATTVYQVLPTGVKCAPIENAAHPAAHPGHRIIAAQPSYRIAVI